MERFNLGTIRQRLLAAFGATALALGAACCGSGGGGDALPPTNSLGLPIVGGNLLGSSLPATVAALLNQLAGVAAPGSSLPTLSLLTGALPMGTTLNTLPVIGAVEGTTLGGLTNIPLSNTSSLPTLLSLLPVPLQSQIGNIPVLGAVVVGQGGTLSALVPVLEPTLGTPNLLGVLAVVTQGPATPAELLALAQSLGGGGSGLGIINIIGSLAGNPPSALTSALPTSLLAGIEGLLGGLLI